MSKWYKLNDDHTTEQVSLYDYALWNKDNDKNIVIGKYKIGKDIEVSTVFLGLDHCYTECNKPLLFETMVFGGEHDQFMSRYETYEKAVEGHNKAVIMCNGVIIKENDEPIINRFDILDL